MKKKDLHKLRRAALSEAKGNILEIGFGSGENLLEYPETVHAITALDPSSELFDLARTKISDSAIDVRFVLGTAERMPFRDSEFDTVVSTWTLCSIPDVDRALDEVRRVLKTGGSFLFLEHGLGRSSALRWFQHVLTPLWKMVSGGCHLDRDIRTLIEKHGFVYTDTGPSSQGMSNMFMSAYQGSAMKR